MKTAFLDPGRTTSNSGENVAFVAEDAPGHLDMLKDQGIEVARMNYGARIVFIRTTDRYGCAANIVFGYSGLDAYVADISSCLGAVVGGYANIEMACSRTW